MSIDSDSLASIGLTSLIIAVICLVIALVLMLNVPREHHYPQCPGVNPDVPATSNNYENIDGVPVDRITALWYRGTGQSDPYPYVRSVNLSQFVYTPEIPLPSPPMSQYNFSHEPTIGVFSGWDTDMTALGGLLQWAIDILKYCNQGGAPSDNVVLGFCIVTDILQLMITQINSYALPSDILAAYASPTDYPLVVLLPRLACMYALTMPSQQIIGEVIDLITTIITEPGVVLGNTYNSDYYLVCTAAPWIVAQNYNNNYLAARNNTQYLKAIAAAQNVDVDLLYDEGIIPDGAYFTKFAPQVSDTQLLTPITDYSLLFQKYANAHIFYQVDERVSDYQNFYKKYAEILLHPTIRSNTLTVLGQFSGALEYTPELDSLIPTDNNYGLRCIPAIGYLRWFGEGFSFSVRGQNAKMSAFVATAENNNLLQYYTQYRDFVFASNPLTPVWPNTGFINADADTSLISVPMGQANLIECIPSVGSKTASFVDGNYGFFYQQYQIAELGDYSVEEYIVLNAETGLATINVSVLNNSDTVSLVYYYGRSDKTSSFTIAPSSGLLIQLTLSRNQAVAPIVSNFEIPLGYVLSCQTQIDATNYELISNDTIIGLSKNSSLMYVWPYTLTRFPIVYDYDDNVYIFVPQKNQFVLTMQQQVQRNNAKISGSSFSSNQSLARNTGNDYPSKAKKSRSSTAGASNGVAFLKDFKRNKMAIAM